MLPMPANRAEAKTHRQSGSRIVRPSSRNRLTGPGRSSLSNNSSPGARNPRGSPRGSPSHRTPGSKNNRSSGHPGLTSSGHRTSNLRYSLSRVSRSRVSRSRA